jgi:large repetitive protein
MKRKLQFFLCSLIVLIILLDLSLVHAQVKAFPEAEGYGKSSLGGRGGQVIEVTNLNDAGTGSFRAACLASGPRIVVFRVAGIIELASDIVISNPYITIAGQTAPGDGICIKYLSTGNANRAITIETNNVVIRYLRIRCGFSQAAMDYGVPFFMENQNAYNVIIDHCSSSWHPGRTAVGIWPVPGKTINNITIQRHLAAEPLYGGNYPNGARGAFLFGSGLSTSDDGIIDRITMFKNLMAHHSKRHPEAKTCQSDPSHYIATYQFINNVAYHFKYDGMMLRGNENNSTTYHFIDEEVCHYNVIGNYFKRSEADPANHSEISITPGVRLYVGDYTYGNIGPNRSSSTQNPWDIVSFTNYGPDEHYLHASSSPYQSTSAFDPTNIPSYATADGAYADVLNDVGANKAINADGTFRNVSDAVDVRIVNEVINNTGNYINSPADVGGWPAYTVGSGAYTDTDHDGMPDTYENAKGFNPGNAADGVVVAANGYTNVENFLNGATTAANPNIALNKTATASTNEAANTPAKAVDGNSTTRWAASSGALNEWLKVDLGSVSNITGSEVTWEQGINYKYKIEVSIDNSTWALKVDKTATTGTSQTVSDNFSASARYVRITITGVAGGNWASISELKVFGGACLPSGWTGADIGGVAGQSSCAAGGTYTVVGGGADIWGTSDQFRYTYKSLNGDGYIIAKVSSIQNTDPWAKSGVMIRESLASGSAHVDCMVTSANGISFQLRAATNGTTTSTVMPALAAPYWVKLQRTGNVFSAYRSADGSTWTQIGTSTTVTMGTNIYIGLAVTSHLSGTLCTSTLSDVNVNGVAGRYANAVYVKTLPEKKVSVYPNPATGLARITLAEFSKNSSVSIVDGNGKVLASYKNLNREYIDINLSRYQSGHYFAILRNSKRVKVLKIVKL